MARAGQVRVRTGAPVVALSLDPDATIWDIDRSNNYFGKHVVSFNRGPAG